MVAMLMALWIYCYRRHFKISAKISSTVKFHTHLAINIAWIYEQNHVIHHIPRSISFSSFRFNLMNYQETTIGYLVSHGEHTYARNLKFKVGIRL